MTNSMKRQEYLLPFARFFTREGTDAYDAIPFRATECFGDEVFPALASPSTWSAEAVSVMAEAANHAVPADLRANEENTVPSWLWRHQSRSMRRESEFDLRDIFNRAVGAAAAKAWKLGLFTSEKHASTFFDEARFALMQRHIAIMPEVIASWGLSWAYGIEVTPRAMEPKKAQPQQQISNATIDALLGKLGKDASKKALWKKLFASHGKEMSTVPLRLCDIAADWHSQEPNPARAAIDLLALRHNDGSMNIGALRQAARILTILLDLHERNDVTIGFVNLAPLLLAFGLAYDSDAARAMAASLAALVTAECTATSAELAALRGMSAAFTTSREAVMRSLRNHRRAVYGDDNDYEKLSVLPAPLPLKNCPDLSLVAEAQRRWDEAIEFAQSFGLRTVQTTDLTPSPVMTVLMSSASQGLEPLQRLTSLQSDDGDMPHTVLHPALGEAFLRLGYPASIADTATLHILGTRSLRKAPVINTAGLKARGLDEAALEKIEAYLSSVNAIQLAVTTWIIGVEFCRKQLSIPERKLESPHFCLLKHLGFSDADIEGANRYCYGHGTLRNAKLLSLRHRPLFACNAEISPEAHIRMAAAVQSFISGDTGAVVTLPAAQSIECGAETTLLAWRSGLKSLTVVFDPDMAVRPVAEAKSRRLKASALPSAKPVAIPRRTAPKKNILAAAPKKTPGTRRTLRRV